MDDNRRFYLAAATAFAVGMLLLAPLSWPYGYYRLLRVVVAVAGCFLALAAHRSNERWLVVGLVATVLLFNPLIPLHFERHQWMLLNFAAAVVFGAAWIKVRRGG